MNKVRHYVVVREHKCVRTDYTTGQSDYSLVTVKNCEREIPRHHHKLRAEIDYAIALIHAKALGVKVSSLFMFRE